MRVQEEGDEEERAGEDRWIAFYFISLKENGGVEEQRSIETIGNVNIAIILLRVRSTFLRDLYLHFNWQLFMLRAHTPPPLVRTCRWIFYWDIEFVLELLIFVVAAPFSLNVRSLKGLSRPSNRRRHGNRWKILKGLRRLRWQNTYISEGLLNWTRRAAWTQKEIWADSGNFRKMKRMMWEHFCCGHMQLQSICVGSRLWPGKGPFT